MSDWWKWFDELCELGDTANAFWFENGYGDDELDRVFAQRLLSDWAVIREQLKRLRKLET